MRKTIFLSLQFIFILFTAFSQTNEKFKVFPTENKSIPDFCFFEDGDKLAVADNSSVKFFSTSSQKLLGELLNENSGRIMTIDVSKNNSLLASGSLDGKIVIWNLPEKSVLKAISLKDAIVTSVSLSPDNNYLIAGSSTGTVLLYDIKNERKKLELHDHKKDVTAVKFSPDGKIFATAGGDKTIKLYSTENQSLVASLSGHTNWIRDILFTDNGQTLVSCGDDSRLIFWNLNDTKTIISKKVKHLSPNWITSVDLFKKNEAYTVGGSNGKIEIYTSPLKYSIKIKSAVNKVLFVPDRNDMLEIVVASNGRGLLLIKAIDMRLHEQPAKQPLIFPE